MKTALAPWARSSLVALAALLLAACGEGGEGGEPAPLGAYLTELSTLDELAAMSSDADAPNVKYLARVEGREPPEPFVDDCYFQNMQRYSWHLQFLQSFPEHAAMSFDEYRNLVIRGGTRTLWGGSVQYFAEAEHPRTKQRGVVVYLVYAEAGGLTVDAVAEVDARLKACMPFATDLLVFVPELPDQEAFLEAQRDTLRTRGVDALFARDLAAE